jgi:RNA polymerase sigma factor (sigma-70 family)
MSRPDHEDAEAEAVFTELYHATARDVLAFLLRRCGTAEDAADFLAETYMIVWSKRHTLPNSGEARPWLFGVARNVMHRNRERTHRTDALAQQLASALAISTPEQTTTTTDDRTDTQDRLMDALAELSEIDQEILKLTVWDGLSPTETATALRLSPNLVRVRAHRARAKLKAALASSHDLAAHRSEERHAGA